MARRDDLSTPRGTPGGPSYDPDAFARFAEKLARFLGHRSLPRGPDDPRHRVDRPERRSVVPALGQYPFILLNLAFSTQAAYAAPLILLAQNRQTDRDRAEVERDREMNSRALADTEYLAREIAGIRLALESKPDRDDVTDGDRSPDAGDRAELRRGGAVIRRRLAGRGRARGRRARVAGRYQAYKGRIRRAPRADVARGLRFVV